MYLSKLRIFGFKSFANKVEVNFPGEGITSVVGPNGCGKSNIIDAIRWVLGEQRAKVLRSGKMEDVIFSGTAERPPLNMAEVSLLINNDSGVLPSEYTQIMITRRAFRNGETEYLINNTPCRLKDIHNLFYDTGMGAASYSLIEAKMIDSILSDKAEERRVMFEEASGISKYKQQRKETLRQLERTAVDYWVECSEVRHLRSSFEAPGVRCSFFPRPQPSGALTSRSLRAIAPRSTLIGRRSSMTSPAGTPAVADDSRSMIQRSAHRWR